MAAKTAEADQLAVNLAAAQAQLSELQAAAATLAAQQEQIEQLNEQLSTRNAEIAQLNADLFNLQTALNEQQHLTPVAQDDEILRLTAEVEALQAQLNGQQDSAAALAEKDAQLSALNSALITQAQQTALNREPEAAAAIQAACDALKAKPSSPMIPRSPACCSC